jgi:polar amino acid transport system substrate-binding protein
MKAITFVLAVVLAVAGCSSAEDPVGDQEVRAVQPLPAGAKEVRSLPVPSVDTSCGDATASYRPHGPLPAPGAFAGSAKLTEIHQRGRLIVGVDQNTYNFAFRNPDNGQIEGFAIDVAKQIAAAIFGDPTRIQLRVLTSAQRVPAVKNEEVDLVVHSMTTNCERWKDVDFSAVFFEAKQRVLVREGFDYQGLASLAGKKVCATEGSTSLARIVNADVDPKPIGVQVAGWTDCLVMMQQYQVDAISTDNTILAGLREQDPFVAMVGDPIADEPYAIAIPQRHEEFVRFVNAVLEQMKTSGAWMDIYNRWMASLVGPVSRPPDARYRG